MATFESGQFERTVGECGRVCFQTHGPGRDVIWPDIQSAECNLGTGALLQSAPTCSWSGRLGRTL